MKCATTIALALSLALASAWPAGAQSADAGAAAAQYRIARRLVAEDAEGALAALQRVVELDPQGELADDALVEQALLAGISEWPEGLAGIDEESASNINTLLYRVLHQYEQSDRAAEARYYRALLRLAPISGFDAAAARVELTTVAVTARDTRWSWAAHYARAWLDEQLGEYERALGGYQRLVVDAPTSVAATRARQAMGRILLQQGEYAAAAIRLQEAVDAEPGDETAISRRELAVRLLLHQRWGPGAARKVVPATGIRSPVGPFAMPEGGVVLGDRRSGSLQRYDVDGQVRDRWTIPKLQSIAVGPWGTVFAASSDALYRLGADGAQDRLAALGPFASPKGMAADGMGRLWLIDRRGAQLGRLEPGATTPAKVWSNRGSRLDALVWDGRRVVVLDGRQRALHFVLPGGAHQSVPLDTLQRPVALTCDAAGRLGVLDSRGGAVVVLDSSGRALDRLVLSERGVSRPSSVAFGSDGTMHVFDGGNDAWMMIP